MWILISLLYYQVYLKHKLFLKLGFLWNVVDMIRIRTFDEITKPPLTHSFWQQLNSTILSVWQSYKKNVDNFCNRS